MAHHNLTKEQADQAKAQTEARAVAEFERSLKDAIAYAQRDPIATANGEVQRLLGDVSGITMAIQSPLRQTLATQLIGMVQALKDGPAFPIGHSGLLHGRGRAVGQRIFWS